MTYHRLSIICANTTPSLWQKKNSQTAIPSISLNLRIGENCAIDRKDRKQALAAMATFAENAHRKNRSIVIFPEGTRSRTGVPKPFQRNGLKIILKKVPSAKLVPVTVNNSWKVDRYGKFPYGIGNHIKVTIHKPIPTENRDHEELIQEAETVVHEAVTSTAI